MGSINRTRLPLAPALSEVFGVHEHFADTQRWLVHASQPARPGT